MLGEIRQPSSTLIFPRPEQRQRYSATCAHMSHLAGSSISLGDPPAPNAAAVIWKKFGGLSASPAVTKMPRVVWGFDSESDEAAQMEPSSEMSNLCSTQRPVLCRR